MHGYSIAEGGEWQYEDIINMPLEKRIEIDMKLSELIPIDDDYYYSTYKIPKPANYDKLKKELLARKITPGTIPSIKPQTQQAPTNITKQQKNKQTWEFINKLADFFSFNAH